MCVVDVCLDHVLVQGLVVASGGVAVQVEYININTSIHGERKIRLRRTSPVIACLLSSVIVRFLIDVFSDLCAYPRTLVAGHVLVQYNVARACLIGLVIHLLRRCSLCLFIHISEPTRLRRISYAVFCLKKKKKTQQIKHQ